MKTLFDDVECPLTSSRALDEIRAMDVSLFERFADRIRLEPALTRALVSFQANKQRPAFRWYRFKEAFSASLVEYLLTKAGVRVGTVLDPFAGSGTALFAAAEQGLDADGIELVPIGQEIISTRLSLQRDFTQDDFAVLARWVRDCPWQATPPTVELPVLPITRGAYPPERVEAIQRYLTAVRCELPRVQAVLRFALLCILESISYTSKDGQYLRWDMRASRRQSKKLFHKGQIADFSHAVREKLCEILTDTGYAEQLTVLETPSTPPGAIHLFRGSCLDVLPMLPAATYQAVITSPPYCNRYDYTRTYALELALLGINQDDILELRQAMLSCTVENRAKDLIATNPAWAAPLEIIERQRLLREIIGYLESQRIDGALNNTGIPRMVKGYFQEMACVIWECARVLQPGAPLMMVNDNVRYAGASISVDLILSAIAEETGFTVEGILVLPNGKGNSSQQMGEHGREPLRKCVYLWRRV